MFQCAKNAWLFSWHRFNSNCKKFLPCGGSGSAVFVRRHQRFAYFMWECECKCNSLLYLQEIQFEKLKSCNIFWLLCSLWKFTAFNKQSFEDWKFFCSKSALSCLVSSLCCVHIITIFNLLSSFIMKILIYCQLVTVFFCCFHFLREITTYNNLWDKK